MKIAIILIILLLVITRPLQAFDPDGSVEIKVVINKGPNVESFLPNDGDTIVEGDTLTISVTANDPNSDTLEYQFYINGVVKEPWTQSSTFSYTLTETDIGLNTIKAEIRDSLETIETDTVEIFVFRASPNMPTQ